MRTTTVGNAALCDRRRVRMYLHRSMTQYN